MNFALHASMTIEIMHVRREGNIGNILTRLKINEAQTRVCRIVKCDIRMNFPDIDLTFHAWQQQYSF